MNTTRDPDETRRKLLEAAFQEIYQVGFRSASLDRILRTTGVTKGALYHHFENKIQLGYAVVDEVVATWILDQWVKPLAQKGDAIELIKNAIDTQYQWAIETNNIAKGCPLNNLAIEMSPIDEGFRQRIEVVFDIWRDAFANALRRGQEAGTVRSDINPVQMGHFILAALEGLAGMAKNSPGAGPELNIEPLFTFIDNLRAADTQAA